MKKLLLSAIVILGFSAVSFGQAVQTANANATLITPISMTKDVDLEFGTIGSSPVAGTVTLTAAASANPQATPGVHLVATGGATRAAAKFTVSGEGSSTFSVDYPTTVSLASGTSTPLSVAISTNFTGNTSALSGGTKVLYFGGVLTVPANTVAGVYTNTTDLTVTVNYN